MLPSTPAEIVILIVALLVLGAGITWIIKSQASSRERDQARLQEIQAKLKELEEKNN